MACWLARSPVLVAISLSIAQLVACGGDSSSADGVAGGETGATCADYVRALCDWQVRCDTTRTITLEACLLQNSHTCEFFELPGVTAGSADFRICVTRYERDRCTSPFLRCAFPPGTLTENCASDLQCTTGLCVKPAGSCGKCGYLPKRPLGGQCGQVSDCQGVVDCVAGVCTERRKPGETCGGAQTCSPLSGDAAVACVGGVCTAGGRPGEPCLEADDGGAYCGGGTVCSASRTCVPLRLLEPGEPCGDFDRELLHCRGGACKASVCVSRPGIGESCKKISDFEQCAEGMYCDSAVDQCVLMALPTVPENCDY